MELLYDYVPRKLEYLEKEKRYKMNIIFFEMIDDFDWDEENKIVLTFDEKGKFIEANSQIKQSLTNKTIEETEKMYMATAMECKERMDRTIQSLILPKKKEEIVFEKDAYDEYSDCLLFIFDLDGLNFVYYKYLNKQEKDVLECAHKDETQTAMVKIHNIPSLKGIEAYIQNHPKVRVKYVNQLTNIDLSKNKNEEV